MGRDLPAKWGSSNRSRWHGLSSDASVTAATALGRLGDARAVDPLLAALFGDDHDLVGMAASALAQLGAPGIAALVRALPRIRDTNRFWVVAALRVADAAATLAVLDAALAAPDRRAIASNS